MRYLSKTKEKVVITVAPVGVLTFVERTSFVPITPEEIAQKAYRSYQAGVSIVHIHPRDVKTKLATPDLKVYGDIVRRIKEKCNIITQIGGGIGTWYDPITNQPVNASDEQKMALLNINPKPDMLTVNLGTFDFTLPGYGYLTFFNTPDFQRKIIKGIIEKKLGMEFEIYDVSHL